MSSSSIIPFPIISSHSCQIRSLSTPSQDVCQFCRREVKCKFECQFGCDVRYCKRECLNRDFSFHSLNCMMNLRMVGEHSCDFCGLLVPSSAICQKCEKKFVCPQCIGKHSECDGNGKGFTDKERKEFLKLVEPSITDFLSTLQSPPSSQYIVVTATPNALDVDVQMYDKVTLGKVTDRSEMIVRCQNSSPQNTYLALIVVKQRQEIIVQWYVTYCLRKTIKTR